MAACRASNRADPVPAGGTDWPHLFERAAEALLRRLGARRELTPRQVADTVTAALPPEVGAWVAQLVRREGWLEAGARIPFDLLDAPAACRASSPETCRLAPECSPRGPGQNRAGPAVCRFRSEPLVGGRRELVRLAVFGVPGEGVRADAKRREATYQQRCAEILREARDLESLASAAARALGHPEVHADPVLHGMLRAFIAEREAELRSRARVPGAEQDEEVEAVAPAQRPAEFRLPLRERVQITLSKLCLEFDGYVTHLNEVGAEQTLVRIRDLRRRFPGQVEMAVVEKCEEQFRQMVQQRDRYRQQLEEFVEQAAAAVRRGDQRLAAWALRRLSAIHGLLPAVLPLERLEPLRARILEAAERVERHEAARQLVAREQAVGAEIKQMGAVIHHYRLLLEQQPRDEAALQRAEAAYRRALEQVRTHDDEWLADLMIELDGLLADLHGPRQRAEQQVDRFVNNVRTALRQMRAEIKLIQRQHAPSPDRP